MQKLHRIKSPALKRAVIGLGLVAAFGAGYQVNEAKWQRLQRLQPKEAPKKCLRCLSGLMNLRRRACESLI